MSMCLFMLDSHAFTSNKQVGLENKGAHSTRDGNLYQFFLSKPLEPASFGASFVLSTIHSTGIFEHHMYKKVGAFDLENQPTLSMLTHAIYIGYSI